ncbi:MAG: ATP-binding cassette domain-containing protein [Kiritimatiellae bacterium]|nr:ATP-binding cassette domain-containing protein [Kiritimatiellia bacterium]
MSIDYKKEFFDREYTAREAYGRVWKYARKYRFRIVVGIVCGMLTAGTLLPLFQVIQPTLEKVSANEQAIAQSSEPEAEIVAQPEAGAQVQAPAPKKHGLAKKMDEAAKLPSWYPKAEKIARKLGIELQDESGAMGGALVLMAIVIIPFVAFVRLGLIFLNQYCLTWSASKVVADLRVDILKHIQRQSVQFHGRIDVGQLMSRATGDPQIVQSIIQTMLSELARAPFEIAVSVGFIIWFAIANHQLPTLAVIFIGMPAFMLPVVSLGKMIRKWSRRTLERSSVVGSRIHEILTCVRVVKAYDTEDFENEKYETVNRTLFKTTMRAVRWGLLVGPTVETIGIVLICAFLVYCFAAHVTLANVIPMIAPLLLIYKPLKQMANLQVQIETAQASLQRIWSILDVNMELPEKPDAKEKTSFDGKIIFDDVCFRYDTADHDAVSHASFEIGRGKMVAVVGGTGSGKTTMSGLLARFFDPSSGRVTMDGTDLRDLRIADLRRLVGSVQQETILFNDTIEENIRYGTPNATHEQVVAAAKLANAHEFIMAQPEGYSRLAGEKGFALSGGERQRIAIARAILRNPPILILDEATSALDTVTEKLVQDALTNLMQNRTVFAIAHRLSTIRDADLILVMEHGEIVERGTHDELYAANGVYRRLCDMQHQK